MTLALHPIIEKAVRPEAPLALRLAAARGRVPVPVTALLPGLILLLEDSDESVRQAARGSLDGVGDGQMLGILSDAQTPGIVVDHVLVHRRPSGDLLLAALSHPAASDEALCEVASAHSGEAIDMLLSNQQRLIACPEIVDRLTANHALSRLQRNRLEDFREHLLRAPAEEELEAFPSGAPAGEIVTDEELKSLLAEVGDLPFIQMDLGDLLESDGMELAGDEGEAPPTGEGTWWRLARMSGRQRLIQALRGNREERGLLIMDRNRIISAAVLKNPRITDSEVEQFASLRVVHEEILRIIGQTRAWMRSTAIVRTLVRNPKTPAGVAMNHIPRLGHRDLHNIVRDHNVPEAVRRLARRQIELRESSPAKPGGRH